MHEGPPSPCCPGCSAPCTLPPPRHAYCPPASKAGLTQAKAAAPRILAVAPVAAARALAVVAVKGVVVRVEPRPAARRAVAGASVSAVCTAAVGGAAGLGLAAVGACGGGRVRGAAQRVGLQVERERWCSGSHQPSAGCQAHVRCSRLAGSHAWHMASAPAPTIHQRLVRFIQRFEGLVVGRPHVLGRRGVPVRGRAGAWLVGRLWRLPSGRQSSLLFSRRQLQQLA